MLNGPLDTQILDTGKLFDGLESEGRLGLAVSGGPDSVALMLLAAEWAAKHAVTLIVYTVNHGLRAEAASECQFVGDAAKALGLSVQVLEWTSAKPKTGLQAAARSARYRLIGEAMARDDVGLLLTAHHLDDQAETMMMRLAHGSGIGGLGGMSRFSTVEGVCICRPLLDVRRDDLLALLSARHQEFIEDPSNQSTQFERVRWRQALPELGAMGVSPERLGQLSRRLKRADAALNALAEQSLEAIVTTDDFGVCHIDRSAFEALEPEIAVRVLANLLGNAGLGQVETVCERLMRPEFSGAVLGGFVLHPRKDSILIFRESGRAGLRSEELAPGGSIIWDGRFEIRSLACETLEIAPAGDLSANALRSLCDGHLDLPMAALKTVPLVRSAKEEILAFGAHLKSSLVEISALPCSRRTKA
jgi:tRNA(Ile)-lysidine synthase